MAWGSAASGVSLRGGVVAVALPAIRGDYNNRNNNLPGIRIKLPCRRNLAIRASESEIMAATGTDICGIKIVNNPPESKLTELGVRSWSKWGCPPSKFPWTYSSKETCYLLKGKVKVYPEGSDEAAEFGAGDLVEFPKGMSCTWEVSEAVDKHYKFE